VNFFDTGNPLGVIHILPNKSDVRRLFYSIYKNNVSGIGVINIPIIGRSNGNAIH
jgi:hypothetical protein